MNLPKEKSWYKVVDNFLPKDEFDRIKNIIYNKDLKWGITKCVIHGNNENKCDCEQMSPQMVCLLYVHNKCTDPQDFTCWEILYAIQKRLESNLLLARLKINLQMCTEKPYKSRPYHIDLSEDSQEYLLKGNLFNGALLNAILYLDTNNGYTEFSTGEKIMSKENRFLIFDSQVWHRGVGQSDSPTRCNINFNFVLANKTRDDLPL